MHNIFYQMLYQQYTNYLKSRNTVLSNRNVRILEKNGSKRNNHPFTTNGKFSEKLV